MKRAKIIKFVKRNKKQIIFALFAFIYFVINKNPNVLICVAPLMSNIPDDPEREQKKQEEKQATEKVGATAARAAADYFTGGAYEKVRNAPVVGAVAKGAEKVVGKAANVANVATLGAFGKASKKLDDSGLIDAADKAIGIAGSKGSSAEGVPKNTNPNPNAMTSQTTMSKPPESVPKNEGAADGLSKPKSDIPNNKGLLPSEKSGEAKTDDNSDKSNKKTKKNLLPTENSKSGEAKTDFIIENEASDRYMKKFSVVGAIGCIGILFSAFIIFFPAILLAGGLMTKNTMTGLECVLYDSEDCEKDESGSFFSKTWNYIKYGTFGSNSEVTAEKLKDIYEKIEKKYDFKISIPLLSSSLFYEATDTLEYDENGEPTVTEDGKMIKRLKYAEDLALLQIIEGETIYECIEVEISGKKKYREVPVYENVDEELIITGKCNSNNVNKYIKRIENNKYDEEAYFEALLKSDILVKLYSDYYEDFDDEKVASEMIVDNIRDSYNMYKALYIRDESNAEGEIPEYLMGDPDVNLQMPLKGAVTITSPFGSRTNPLTDNEIVEHNGLDAVSTDRTIYAAGDGIVSRKYFERYAGGNIIEITHTSSTGEKYISLYAHADEYWVEVGDEVISGDPIGQWGSSGNVTGPHLHFSFWDASTNREYLDPINLFTEAINYNDF